MLSNVSSVDSNDFYFKYYILNLRFFTILLCIHRLVEVILRLYSNSNGLNMHTNW